MMPTQARDPETYAIIGAAMAVHAELGCGFLEAVYQEALQIELALRGIPADREHKAEIYYRGQLLDGYHKADFLCYGTVIVEAKAIREIGPIERAQVLNYLQATGRRRALLINFGAASLEFERIVR
jgi:GxxExxY protein